MHQPTWNPPPAAGEYTLPVLLFSLFVFVSGCESTSDLLIDSLGEPPQIVETSLFPSVINTDTILVGPERKSDDVLSIRFLISARIIHAGGPGQIVAAKTTLYKETRQRPLASVFLRDDGAPPDSSAGDSTFTAEMLVTISRSEIGEFTAEIVAESRMGFRSSSHLLPLRIVRLNQPPFLSNLIAPDTVKLNSQTQILSLAIQATDPDGLADILHVRFDSFRPDGSPSSGNPFQMFDDGNLQQHGDATAGDGIYSLLISLPPETPPGSYRFEFRARDRSNASSNLLTHVVTIVP